MKNSPEMILSKSVCSALGVMGIYFFHPANEGRRSVWEQAQFKANGGKPGVSDLVLLLPCSQVVFVELKTKTGRQNYNQKQFQDIVEALGFTYTIWRNLDDAIKFIKIHTKRIHRP